MCNSFQGIGEAIAAIPLHTSGAIVRHDSGVTRHARDTEDFDETFFDATNEEEATAQLGRIARRASERWMTERGEGETKTESPPSINPAEDLGSADPPSDEHEGEDHVAKIVRRASERWMKQDRDRSAVPPPPAAP